MPEQEKGAPALEGVANFRRLPGRGRAVYRSSSLSQATLGDLLALERLQIGMVIDLRDSAERAHHPDRLPRGAAYLTAGRKTALPHVDKGKRDIALLCEGGPGARPMRNYRRMVEEYTEAFGRAIRAIAGAQTPVLLHCENGKDRAGVLSAILLALRGADRDAIERDYMLSNISYRERNEADLAALRESCTPEQLTCMRALFEVRPAYLQTFFDEAIRAYGSFEAYVCHGLGVRREDLALLRRG